MDIRNILESIKKECNGMDELHNFCAKVIYDDIQDYIQVVSYEINNKEMDKSIFEAKQKAISKYYKFANKLKEYYPGMKNSYDEFTDDKIPF